MGMVSFFPHLGIWVGKALSLKGLGWGLFGEEMGKLGRSGEFGEVWGIWGIWGGLRFARWPWLGRDGEVWATRWP